jgi:hypothetical protein
MLNRQLLAQLCAQDPFNIHALKMLNSGQNDILRLLPFQHFTVPFEGDEVVLTKGLIQDIEAAIGEALIETPAVGCRGKNQWLKLVIPPQLKVEIETLLAQMKTSSPSTIP